MCVFLVLLLLLLLFTMPQSMAHSWSEGDPCQEPTGLPLTTLQRVGQAICKVPPGFNTHPDVSTGGLVRACQECMHA